MSAPKVFFLYTTSFDEFKAERAAPIIYFDVPHLEACSQQEIMVVRVHMHELTRVLGDRH